MAASSQYRYVDRHQHGWWLVGDGRYHTYPLTAQFPEGLTEEDLRDQRGPLTPVVTAPQADLDQMFLELHGAGVHAVSTVLAVLGTLVRLCVGRDGDARRLVAGRPGSWESDRIVKLGQQVGVSIHPQHINQQAARVVAGILSHWSEPGPNDPGYVEVAENLASVLGRVVDIGGGYRHVCDDWLIINEHAEAIKTYVCSLSQARG